MMGFDFIGKLTTLPAQKTALFLVVVLAASPAIAGQNVWIIEQPGKAPEKVDVSPLDGLPDYIPKPKPRPAMPSVKLSAPSDVTDVDPMDPSDQTVAPQ